MLYILAYNAFMLACCGYAAWRGGRWERTGAAAMFAASVFTSAIVLRLGAYGGAVFALDIAMMAALLAIALLSGRWWSLWAAGFHLTGLMIHAAVLAHAQIGGLAHAHALGLFSYLTLASLAAGTWRRRTAATSRRFSPPWPRTPPRSPMR